MTAMQWQLFDTLDADAFSGLKADIRERGVLVPVEMDEHGSILDGHHRVRAWSELRSEGVRVPQYPTLVRVGMSDAEKRRHVIALNLYRRHLTGEARARAIRELRADGMTLQQIATTAGVSKSQVHRDMQGDFPDGNSGQPATIVNARGQQRPATYKPRAVSPPSVFATTQQQLQTVMDAAQSGALADLPSATVAADHKVIRDGAKETRREAEAARIATLPPVELARPDVRLDVADARSLPLDDATVDLIVTSPPYGLEIDYDQGDVPADEWPAFMVAWLAEARRVTKPSGRLAVNIPLDTSEPYIRPTYVETVTAAISAGWEYASTIVWAENNSTKGAWALGSQGSSARPRHVSQVEMIVLLSNGPWAPSSDNADDITREQFLEAGRGPWTFSGESRKWEGHPAPYPVELPRRLIRYLCRVGDVVLDPFVGSGTTALAAVQLGRHAIGFDISPGYVESARRRMQGAD